MFETALHTGTDQPELLWVAVPTLAAFAGGLGIGLFSRVRSEAVEPATDGVAGIEPSTGGRGYRNCERAAGGGPATETTVEDE